VQHEIEINGRIRQVVVNRADDGFAVVVDGRTWQVNAARVDAHTLSLVIGEDEIRLKSDATTSRSYEVTVVPDPTSAQLVVHVAGPVVSFGRQTTPVLVALDGRPRPGRKERRKEDGAQVGSGPQRIIAPMPGKIIHVLVRSGEAVHAGQPLVVVEAMKMENELRADCDGTVAEIHVQEGMSVDAGVLLVVVR
jgi:biotin carboxyl carrier protein